ncbi:hypothetical protein PIB30_106778 [Stylosanthes scabra]|uniref:Uncharacterized protein n=1 Tax=Stylosanthes scabra TaxID=79078 RepID=A0ABU6XY26_9FABA|nr:hypothetical protein [Stylosanthes scabra]
MGQAGRVLAAGGLQEAKVGEQEEQGILDGWIASYRGLNHVRGHQRADGTLICIPLVKLQWSWDEHPHRVRCWVDKRSEDVNDVFLAELKRLQEERQAIIDAGDPEDDDTASGPPILENRLPYSIRRFHSRRRRMLRA